MCVEWSGEWFSIALPTLDSFRKIIKASAAVAGILSSYSPHFSNLSETVVNFTHNTTWPLTVWSEMCPGASSLQQRWWAGTIGRVSSLLSHKILFCNPNNCQLKWHHPGFITLTQETLYNSDTCYSIHHHLSTVWFVEWMEFLLKDCIWRSH